MAGSARGSEERRGAAPRADAEAQHRFERLELKYLIDEDMARTIRDEIRPTCIADPHDSPDHEGGYPIYSLYLDTDTLAFHRAKLRGEPDRLKLRIRTYGPDGPAHLEVKRKCRDVIEKTRATVARDRCDDAVRGFGAPLERSASQRENLERFASMAARTGAEPKLLVRYVREAWASVVDRYARVTFDRRIAAQRVGGYDLEGDPEAWRSLAGRWIRTGHHSPVLLELKCETRVPAWMAALIRRHGLVRQGFSKYCEGIVVTERCALGEDAAPGPRWAFV